MSRFMVGRQPFSPRQAVTEVLEDVPRDPDVLADVEKCYLHALAWASEVCGVLDLAEPAVLG